MKKLNNSKSHHFVPKRYLEFFTDNGGFLHLYSKRYGMCLRQKPNKTMKRNKYYKQVWLPNGIDPNCLEKHSASEIEPKGLEAINKLIDAGNITDDDIAVILHYLEFQRIRVPRQLDTFKKLKETTAKLIVSQTSEGRDALRYCTITMKDSDRFNSMKTLSGVLISCFARMVWEVIEAEEGSCFITSDSPVTFLNEKFFPPTEPGIALYGTMVAYPISSKHLLLMKYPEYERGEKGDVDALPPDIEDEDRTRTIEVRRDLLWDREKVNRQNWLMYMQSQDLIAAPSEDVLEDTIRRCQQHTFLPRF